jgi:hypothetical protein
VAEAHEAFLEFWFALCPRSCEYEGDDDAFRYFYRLFAGPVRGPIEITAKPYLVVG